MFCGYAHTKSIDEDAELKNLEDSTMVDPKVEESWINFCILLHIRWGNTDAVKFSTIYPQKFIPCITTIGYNGAQVWQGESSLMLKF